jgi:putative flavoprotein involved in K+ transport
MPFPPTWQMHADMLANWFETYAWALQINVWGGAGCGGTLWGHGALEGSARGGGSERALSPRHLIFANGVPAIFAYSVMPGLDGFAGGGHSTASPRAPGAARRCWCSAPATAAASPGTATVARTTIIQRGSTTV